MSKLHDRMPVIMPEEQFDQWLDPKNEDVAALQELLRPYPAEEMTAFPIGTRVKSQGPDCIARLSA